jgi:hypothetical protein
MRTPMDSYREPDRIYNNNYNKVCPYGSNNDNKVCCSDATSCDNNYDVSGVPEINK